jgi:hypothetical protein
MVRPIETPAFWSAACPVRRRFFVFRRGIERCFGISLPDPSRDDLKGGLSSFKQFCSALLERRKSTWSEALLRQRVGVRTRFSVAHSLFLFRKVIPSPRPSLEPLFEKVQVPSPEPDPAFLDFVRRELPRLVPRGWDRHYSQACLNVTVPTKACFEKSTRGIENSRMGLLLGEDDPRQSFVESVLATYAYKGRIKARLTAVETGGKWRVLSIPSIEMNYLRPLHTCLYDYLSRYDWLLRGDAKPTSFKGFEHIEGEVFVSGDYESATDNLNQSVQKEILRIVLQGALNVPNEVKRLAFSSLSLLLTRPRGSPDDVVEQKSGQMMGNLLSFPLLCLVNYLTFRFLVRGSPPVKINGDDIVFRSSPEIANKWMEGVGASGLVLSKGKTLVDRRFFSLNSCLFQASKQRVVPVPFVRCKTLFGVGQEEDLIGSLAGRFSSFCPGFFGRRRLLWRSIFLRENSGYINQSCRSLSRGLGVPVQSGELKESGLWPRELRYLELPSERKPPPTSSVWSVMPSGHELTWVDKTFKRSKQANLDLRVAFIEAAWQMPAQTETSYRETYFRGLDLSDRVFLRKDSRLLQRSRLLRKSYAFTRSYLRIREGDLWSRRPSNSCKLEWMPLSRDRFMCSEDYVYHLSIPLTSKRQSSVSDDDCLEKFDIVPGVGKWSFAPPPTDL